MADDDSSWTSGIGSEFGEVDNPEYGGYTEANWNIGAWGDKLSGWDTKGVALPNVPRGTVVYLRNPETGVETEATVVDKGPGSSTGADIDMLAGTREALGYSRNYKGPVQYRIGGKAALDGTSSSSTDESAFMPGDNESYESPSYWGLGETPQEPAQKPEEPTSPLGIMRQRWPDRYPDDESALRQLKIWYPNVGEARLEEYAKSPHGFGALFDDNAATQTPLHKLQEKFPELGKLSEDDALHQLYESGSIDKAKFSFEQFKDRMTQAPGDAGANARAAATGNLWQQSIAFGKELVRQFGPQSKIAALSTWRGLRELAITGGGRTVNDVLDSVYGPQSPEDRQKLIADYQAATPADQKKMMAEALAKMTPELRTKMERLGRDPAQFLDRLRTGLMGLSDQKANQESVDWMNKVIGQIDKDTPGTLPENQERVAKLLAQAPANVVMTAFPALREFGLYGQLYDSNLHTIQAANPGMSLKEADERARAATDAQFPAQDLIAWMFHHGGGAVTSSITNKVLKFGVDNFLTGTTTGATFAANQAILNHYAKRPLTEGVTEAGIEGLIVGSVTHGLAQTPRLGVEMVHKYLARSDAGKVIAGYSDHITNAEPKDLNAFLRGDKNNPIDQATRDRAKDIILSSMDKLGEQPDPVKEELAMARGATGEQAVTHVENAFSLLTAEEKEMVHSDVVATLKDLADNAPKPAEPAEKAAASDSYFYPTVDPPEMQAQRAEERRILTGKLTATQEAERVRGVQEEAVARAREARERQAAEQAEQRAAERGIFRAPALPKIEEAPRKEISPQREAERGVLTGAYVERPVLGEFPETEKAPGRQAREERRILTGQPKPLTTAGARKAARLRAAQFRLEEEQSQAQQRAAEKAILAPRVEGTEPPERPVIAQVTTEGGIIQPIGELPKLPPAEETPTERKAVNNLLAINGLEDTPENRAEMLENIRHPAEDFDIERPEQIDQLRDLRDVLRRSLDCD